MRADNSYKGILLVALPIMLGNFIQFAVALTDSAFLSRVDSLAFAASGNAAMIYITIFTICMGFTQGVQILVARRYGEQRRQDIGNILYHSFLSVGGMALIFMFLLIYFAPNIISATVKSAEIGELMNRFLVVRAWGLIPGTIYQVFVAHYSALGKTKFLTWGSIILALFNIVFDYLLVFGEYGFPQMGLEGVALASVLAECAAMIFGFSYFLLDSETKSFFLRGWTSLKLSVTSRLFKLSYPLMIQMLMATSSWVFFFMMIEQVGEVELEVSQVLRNMYFIAFIPIMGFSTATRTYVSQYISLNNREELIRTTKRLTLLSLFFLLVFIHGVFLYPEALIGLINDRDYVIEQTVPLLYLISGSMVLFSIVGVLFNVVAGSGNTFVSMIIELSCILIYLGTSYYVIVMNYSSLIGVWSMEYVYFGSLGILSVLYLWKGNWMNKKI
jgi:multidrug resistance protein, MATE family